ncbi:MAG: uracil-DNA glycosylase family protein [Rikenellaceae bacterium]|jgi:G:T/U-mismatch repair DNA glycosylase|nr:uracil-DNA glycosylase family protein [Rikenellaceae bacterium]
MEEKGLVEQHPLGFFLPEGVRLLMLGSFPPKRERWSMEFYYPNFANDMWRIFGLVFFGDKDHFLVSSGAKAFDRDRIASFLREKQIGLGDTAQEVIRLKGNASDAFLQVVTPMDLPGVLAQIPRCEALVTTGQKATDTLLSLIEAEEPNIGGHAEFRFADRPMRFYRMPSSSRAYPKPLAEKAADYRRMFEELGML